MDRTKWLVLLTFLALLLIFFSGRILSNLTTPTYWEMGDRELAVLLETRERAYDFVVECSEIDAPLLEFHEIHWVLVPGNRLHIQAIDGHVTLLGWFDPENNTIFMPFTLRHEEWIIRHELMHAIGFMGHDYRPFYTCGLMPEQNLWPLDTRSPIHYH